MRPGNSSRRSERHAQLLRVVVHLILFFRQAGDRTQERLNEPSVAFAADYLLAAYVDLLILCELVRWHTTC